MPTMLNSLGCSLRGRFVRLGTLPDLEKAIEHLNQAITLTHLGDLAMPKWLNNLGLSLFS